MSSIGILILNHHYTILKSRDKKKIGYTPW